MQVCKLRTHSRRTGRGSRSSRLSNLTASSRSVWVVGDLPRPHNVKKRQGKQRINRRRHERWPIHLPNSAENSNAELSSSGEVCSWLNQVVQTYQLLFSRQPLLSENSRRNRSIKACVNWAPQWNGPEEFLFCPTLVRSLELTLLINTER